MANDVNLLYSARAVMAAVQHLPENGLKDETLGALQAMQDPSFTQLRQTINPLVPSEDKSLAWVTKSGRSIKVPRVTITYTPQIEQSAITERTKPSTGATASDGASLDVYFDKHQEFTWKKTVPKELLEGAAQNYIKALLSGNLTSGRVAGFDHLLSKLGLEMFRSMVPTLFKPINTDIITAMIAGIGKNLADASASSPSSDAPVIQVVGYDVNGNPKRDPRNKVMDTIVMNQLRTKPIMIGGLKWLQWHRDMKDFRTNQDGFDFVNAYNTLPWMFYFDSTIDTLFGANKAILIDTNAFCWDTVNYHGPAGSNALYAGYTKNDNTYFERGVIRFNQFANAEAGLGNNVSLMSHGFDLRIAEQQDSNDQPEQLITPSIAYGTFQRPVGFFTADNTKNLYKVTGLFAFEMVDPS